jgi:hypothetical protein
VALRSVYREHAGQTPWRAGACLADVVLRKAPHFRVHRLRMSLLPSTLAHTSSSCTTENAQSALCDAAVHDARRPRTLGCPVPSQRRACWIIRSHMALFLLACLLLWRTVQARRTGYARERRLRRTRAAVPLRSRLGAPSHAPYRALYRTGVACTPGHSRSHVRLLQAVEGFGPTGQNTVLGRC